MATFAAPPVCCYARYRSQKSIHQINLAQPGLKLVSEEPYIFHVEDFLSRDECRARRGTHNSRGRK